jgi:adenosylcobinamide kinase/adenosylcobinamide-phosphate guanylyltransferase
LAKDVADAARRHAGTVTFVTNEVGQGIVPADSLSRRFRDFQGRCNQVMAAAADEVYFVVSGIPLKIKG